MPHQDLTERGHLLMTASQEKEGQQKMALRQLLANLPSPCVCEDHKAASAKTQQGSGSSLSLSRLVQGQHSTTAGRFLHVRGAGFEQQKMSVVLDTLSADCEVTVGQAHRTGQGRRGAGM